ncbi:MAG: hypothetical protein K2X77_25535, partial [Candidatus Obscuribacterales bacterium]|nr:hypothetical protein [Candidatus Obscuribacterales bacterium]
KCYCNCSRFTSDQLSLGAYIVSPYGRTLIRNIIIILAGLFVDDPIESSNDEILIAVRTQLG